MDHTLNKRAIKKIIKTARIQLQAQYFIARQNISESEKSSKLPLYFYFIKIVKWKIELMNQKTTAQSILGIFKIDENKVLQIDLRKHFVLTHIDSGGLLI